MSAQNITIEGPEGPLVVEYSDPPFGQFRKLCQASESEQLDLAPLLITSIGGQQLDDCPLTQVVAALEKVMDFLGKM